MKFVHIADVHLGGWKQQPLQDLNFISFQESIKRCILEKVDFVLIAGDLFDTPYPSIEILKETFAEFKKLKDSEIPCFIIAGSHDYSVSGKTFLDVIEKAGFCKNVTDFEENNGKIILKPTIYKDVALYGYPGKKTGLEVKELKNIILENTNENLFKILMLHTTLDRVVGNLPIDYVNSDNLPKADYYALGHIHVLYNKDRFVYPGPLFPNNFKELEELSCGHFIITDTENPDGVERIKIPLKDVLSLSFNLKDAVTATEEVIFELSKSNLEDKIVLLKFVGELENSKRSNINFKLIEDFVMKKGAYFVLKNTHALKEKDEEIEIEVKGEDIGFETMKVFLEKNNTKFKDLAEILINSLSAEKQEGETKDNFTKRIFEESKKILKF
tara:strand:+ start:850 stop:2007 length:1158 start_codon:yes stop_codon:yes gene_type:complete